MRKIILSVAMLFVACYAIQAQTLEEWTQQKKTQKKYLLQQIAALKVYLEYAEKGYEITGKGINTVRNIKNGDFDLHRDFFESLKAVNPLIKKYAKVGDIILYQIRIVKKVKETLEKVRDSKQFTTKELVYCKEVLDFLLDECIKTVEELIQVTTSGVFCMKDDGRLKQIDRLYEDIQSKYTFCSSFAGEMELLSVQRQAEQTEINQSKLLIGIK